MKINNEIQLDFDDVLIEPQRSTVDSRADIDVLREFKFYHSPRTWKGTPVMCANMGFCSFPIADKMADNNMIAVLHKYHSVEELVQYFKQKPQNIPYVWISIGYKKSELSKLIELDNQLLALDIESPNICIDVPNGHMDSFVKYCKEVRSHFEDSIIMAGNVTNTASTQELIIHGGVDIVKVGIGGGCVDFGVKIITADGIKSIQDIVIGDEVLTHKNRLKKVIGTNNQQYDNTFVEINGNKFTADHRFYVIHKSHKTKIKTDKDIETYAEWISCSDLSSDYFLVKNKI